MIYLTWKNGSDGSVVRGWTNDTCSGTQAKSTDFVDNHIDLGRIRPGNVGSIFTTLVTLRKFDPAAVVNDPVTDCKLFLSQYYPRNSTQSVDIPSSPIRYSDTWRFCIDGGTRKNFSGGQDGGYWGSADMASDDISEVQMSWPKMDPAGGIEFSVDRGCTWNRFSSTVGVDGQETTYFGIGSDHGGSATNNQIDATGQCELQFRARVPSGGINAGVRLLLIGMQYDYSE